jgi:hypothetical protein
MVTEIEITQRTAGQVKLVSPYVINKIFSPNGYPLVEGIDWIMNKVIFCPKRGINTYEYLIISQPYFFTLSKKIRQSGKLELVAIRDGEIIDVAEIPNLLEQPAPPPSPTKLLSNEQAKRIYYACDDLYLYSLPRLSWDS